MSADEDVIASYQFEIAVDHFQIFLEDCEREWGDDDLALLYDEGAFARHLGIAAGILSVFTARWGGLVCLELVLRSRPPSDDFTNWDNVAEASIELPSGCLVAYGPVLDLDAQRISVPPDVYRARVYAGGIATVDEYMEEGEDHYRVVLWPAPYEPPALLHAGVDRRW